MTCDDSGITFLQGAYEDCVLVRKTVFMEEQGFVHEFDDVDLAPSTIHISAYRADGTGRADSPVGCVRIYPDGTRNDMWILGRLAVLVESRGHGIGSLLAGEAEKAAASHGARSIELHAQLSKKGFYESLGYQPFGDIDQDEGMDHIWMRKTLDL